MTKQHQFLNQVFCELGMDLPEDAIEDSFEAWIEGKAVLRDEGPDNDFGADTEADKCIEQTK